MSQREGFCRIVFASLLFAVGAAAQNDAVLVLNDVNLIDGAGASPRPQARIVIQGERIQRIEDASAEMPALHAGRMRSGEPSCFSTMTTKQIRHLSQPPIQQTRSHRRCHRKRQAC
jgi:hypothetical protein